MSSPQISVIVPIYGVEKYLRECVDSILSQTFVDFELLLIDDGSPDGSPAICDEYEKSDSRVRVFHKPNGGVGSARNMGIENAKGKWIAFIDADDWLGDRYLENFKIEKLGDSVDFVITNGFDKFGKERLFWKNGEQSFDKEEMEDFYRTLISPYGVYLPPWCRLYKLEIILKNAIKYNEHFSYEEDGCFNIRYLRYVNKVNVVDNTCYYYRFNGQSLSNSVKEYSHYLNCLDCLTEDYIYWNKLYPNNISFEYYFIKFHIIGDSLSILYDLYRREYPRKERKEVIRKINSHIALSEGKYKKYLFKDLPSHRVKIWMAVNLPFWVYDLFQKLLVKIK